MPEKVTAMTESTALADNDLIMVIDDSTGTPDNVKVSLATLKAFVASTNGGGSTGVLSRISYSTFNSSAADVSLSTAYSIQKLFIEVYPAAGDADLYLRLGTSTGGIDTGNNYDSGSVGRVQSGSADGTGSVSSFISLSADFTNQGFTDNAEAFAAVELTLHRITDAKHTWAHGTYCRFTGGGDRTFGACGGRHKVAAAQDMVRITSNSTSGIVGNIRIVTVP